MPLLNSVTTPYAEALLQVVNENSQTEEMVSEVKQLLELINDSPELEKALSSPILEIDAKKKIIIEIFSNKVNSSLLNFLLSEEGQSSGLPHPLQRHGPHQVLAIQPGFCKRFTICCSTTISK